jgi:leader peptidase (prepilin peptidase) / N-methyltransferase
MTWFLVPGLVAGAVGFAAGAFVPEVIARLPEPEPEPEGEGLEAAEDEAEFAKPIDDPKELYADVAATPRLRWWTAAASAVAAGLLGARVGWHPALLFLVYLVPVCVALSVVDWRTRYLPTRLIAPSYVVVGALAVLASALTGDWYALETSVIGWLASFAVFWLMWFLVPRGMAYGDVRLAGLLGMALGWLGVAPLVLGLYTAFIIGAIGGLVLSRLRIFHRRHYPFGPFLALGAWLGAVFTGQLAAAYAWVVDGIASLVS